jgi:indole-3-glycerol phosphate synthase
MNILETIVDHKRGEVASRKRGTRISDLAQTEFYGAGTRSMTRAIAQAKTFAIIAEFKRSSPSAGTRREGPSPVEVAREYAANGAAGISVLTDERFFSGTIQDLRSVRESILLPVLRKDFIIDEFQVHEAKSCGADAVLLIAGILDKAHLADLHAAAGELGLEALVELYDEKEIDRLDLDRMRLIGINNRDLRSFEIDLGRTVTMAAHFAPVKGITLVSESGIREPSDLLKLLACGVRSALIGEHFMKSSSPGASLRELLKGVGHETQG